MKICRKMGQWDRRNGIDEHPMKMHFFGARVSGSARFWPFEDSHVKIFFMPSSSLMHGIVLTHGQYMDLDQTCDNVKTKHCDAISDLAFAKSSSFLCCLHFAHVVKTVFFHIVLSSLSCL